MNSAKAYRPSVLGYGEVLRTSGSAMLRKLVGHSTSTHRVNTVLGSLAGRVCNGSPKVCGAWRSCLRAYDLHAEKRLRGERSTLPPLPQATLDTHYLCWAVNDGF